MQANVRLRRKRDSHDASEHALFAELFPLLDRLRGAEQIAGFFFVRKPPGLRLRFALAAGAAGREAEGAIVAHLSAARPVRSWFASCYEPETYQFGGPAALAAVHAHASADARAWWQWEQRPRESATLGSAVLSLGVLNDLLARVLEHDAAEIWDVWCHLAAAHGSRPSHEGAAVPRITIEQITARASDPEQRVLRAYARANASLASSFRRLHEAGKLLYARRLILPYVALFHWNRFGFALEERVRMFGAMTRAWSPKRWSPRPEALTESRIPEKAS